MIDVYYKPDTGEIVKTATHSFGYDSELPFITHPQEIKISEYKVNTETLQLEKL